MSEPNSPSSPNLIVVLCDQLRRQAIGCYGDADAVTPHIDRLASDGVRFVNSCSTYPICVPFRFTMMTGHYAHTRLVPGIEWRMSPAERTLADEFNEAEYETVYIGKWHLDGGHGRMGSAEQTNLTPVRRPYQGRWQKWLGFELRNGPHDTWYFEDDDPTPKRIDGYQTDGLFDLAMDHLRNGRDKSKPFHLLLSVEPPHPPYEAPTDLEAAWVDRDIQLPPNFRADSDETRARLIAQRRTYYAMIENLDSNVERLRRFLIDERLEQNTIVVFLSDHGELLGAHGLVSKQQPFEESVGMPLIVFDPRQPDRAGSVIYEPTCTEDLFPTFLGLAGLQPRDQLPGRDLSGLVAGSQDDLSRPGVLLEFVAELRERQPFYDEVWRGFRSRRFKYTVKGDKNGAQPWQLFDLETDPYEMTNLVDDPAHLDTVAEHHKWLRQRMEETLDPLALAPAFGQSTWNRWQQE
jgi:arylsulfatase A-like enzyme